MPTIRLPYPHTGQQTVLRQMRRLSWLAAGRRWRKTTLGVGVAVTGPDPENPAMMGALQGKTILWGAPTFDQVRIAWAEMRHGAAGVVSFTQQRMMAEFPTGGKVIFRSLDDPDNARGHTADGVVIDEVEAVKPSAWYEVVRPMLIDTGGWALLMGTPLGRNWFHHEWHLALDRDDSMCWQIPTVGCEIVDEGRRLVRKPHPLENPEIPFEEIEGIFQTSTLRTFRQEILAEFVEGEGAIFRNIKACLHKDHDTPADHEGHQMVMGVDWGQSNDFTVLSVGCRTCRKEVALDRFHGIDYHLQRGRLVALADKWHVSEILAESNAMGQPIIDEMQYGGIPVSSFDTTAASKPPLIESLALCFEREEGTFIDDAVATAELEAYERKVSATTGRPSFSAPEGVHDDTVMARALMWQLQYVRGPWMTLL